MAHWSRNDISSLLGKVIIVTGANSGLGYETSLVLAMHGAHVILAVRNIEKGNMAMEKIKMQMPDAQLVVAHLDLADLSSISEFSQWFGLHYQGLDVLINNAGVMAIPYSKTKDGFETQFGSNHLGHFALTGHLIPQLIMHPGSRVVTISSFLAKNGVIQPDPQNPGSILQTEETYNPWKAYAQSKIANLMFAFELNRRLNAAGLDIISVAAHPGYAATNLQTNGTGVMNLRTRIGNALLAQPAQKGALSELYAATSPDITGGSFYGPKYTIRGLPQKVAPFPQAKDEQNAEKLWEVSEALTGVKYKFLFEE